MAPGPSPAVVDEGVSVLYACDRLSIGYARTPILPPITLTVGRGEFWAVVGRNGSGKTTWFRTMLGLLPAVGGAIRHPAGPPRATYIPQRQGYDLLYPLTALQVVAMAEERGRSFLRPWRAADTARAALDEVGAGELAGRTFRSLSEGQKQRVLLARLLAARPDVAFLDEPTAAMDRVAEREALALLDRVRDRHGTTIVVVSHDLAVARDFADHCLFVDRASQHVAVGSPAEVFRHEGFQARYATLGGADA